MRRAAQCDKHNRTTLWKNGAMSATHASDVIDRDGFRSNVGIVLTRGAGELFLGGRVGGRGWQFPQGGLNRGERAEDALFRELKEEIGLAPHEVKILGATRGWLRYRLPRQYVRDRCIGQKQRWFLLRLLSDEATFRFDNTDAPEFDRWRWVDYWTPVREVVYFKRRVYLRALHDLGPLLFADGLPPYPQWWSEIDARVAKPRVQEPGEVPTV
jgi:putative (di)nucleoside polyphosphate hydrolase